MLITGASGVGKSTLLHLIFRFMDPDSGQVLIDGQDLTDLTLDSYRREVSYCPQNPIMFNVSVLENLRYSDINKYFYKKPYVLSDSKLGNLDGDPEHLDYEYLPVNGDTVEPEIDDYCREFNMIGRINSNPEKYLTSLGDQGAKFSGGERQRFNIIRSLLKESRIMLFDEPTNSLDAKNELVFLNQLSKLRADRKTTIIVSHKLSLAHHADRI